MTTIDVIRKRFLARAGIDPDPAKAPVSGNRVTAALRDARRPTGPGVGQRRVRWTAIGSRDAILQFGKHEGSKVTSLAETESGRGYLRWILAEEFDEALKEIVRKALENARS